MADVLNELVGRLLQMSDANTTDTKAESRRRYPRLEFGIRVFEEKDWMIRDLNPLGCFVETSDPRPVGTELSLQFQIPLEAEYVPIMAKGIVRR